MSSFHRHFNQGQNSSMYLKAGEKFVTLPRWRSINMWLPASRTMNDLSFVRRSLSNSPQVCRESERLCLHRNGGVGAAEPLSILCFFEELEKKPRPRLAICGGSLLSPFYGTPRTKPATTYGDYLLGDPVKGRKRRSVVYVLEAGSRPLQVVWKKKERMVCSPPI